MDENSNFPDPDDPAYERENLSRVIKLLIPAQKASILLAESVT